MQKNKVQLNLIKTNTKKKQKKGNFRKSSNVLVGDDAIKLEKAIDNVVSNWDVETDALFEEDDSLSPRFDKEFN